MVQSGLAASARMTPGRPRRGFFERSGRFGLWPLDGGVLELPGVLRGASLRWSPFFGQAVKLGSPDEKDGPDGGQAEAVWG